MTSVGTILTERGVSIVGRTVLRPCLRAPWTCWLTAADARPPSEAPCCSCTVHSTLHCTLHYLHTSLICITTSQRVLTIHRIIPTLVTLMVGEFILKPWCVQVCSPVLPRHSLLTLCNAFQPPKLPLSREGSGPQPWYMVPRVHNPNAISIGLSRFCRVHCCNHDRPVATCRHMCMWCGLIIHTSLWTAICFLHSQLL